MTSIVADPETPPDQETRGLASHTSVYGRVNGLIVHRLSKDSPAARAQRAQLRGALGREVGTVPEIWDLTLDDRSGYLLSLIHI